MVLWQQCFKGNLSVKTNYIVANVAVTPPNINRTDTNARTSCLPFVCCTTPEMYNMLGPQVPSA